MDQTTGISRVSIRSFRICVCAENFRVSWHVLRELLLFSLPGLAWTIPSGLCGAETKPIQGVWISSFTSCPMPIEAPCQVSAWPLAEPAGKLCCMLWEQSIALPFHLHFNCSAWVQVLQQPFGKYLLESGLISSMKLYAVKRCPKPMREAREESKYLYHFKKVPLPSSLNLDNCLPLHFMPDVTAITREVGWEKGIPLWEMGIYFLSQSVQLGWPPQYILHFSTSQAWCLNLNSTGLKVYLCPWEWQSPHH